MHTIFPAQTDVTPDALVLRHGNDAPRIVNFMIEHAIATGRLDEALQLDRVRRRVEKIAA